jgi:hypothetical protein
MLGGLTPAEGLETAFELAQSSVGPLPELSGHEPSYLFLYPFLGDEARSAS